MLNKNKIVVTGGSGRFGKLLKTKTNNKFIFPNKKQLDILNLSKVISLLPKNSPTLTAETCKFPAFAYQSVSQKRS